MLDLDFLMVHKDLPFFSSVVMVRTFIKQIRINANILEEFWSHRGTSLITIRKLRFMVRSRTPILANRFVPKF